MRVYITLCVFHIQSTLPPLLSLHQLTPTIAHYGAHFTTRPQYQLKFFCYPYSFSPIACTVIVKSLWDVGCMKKPNLSPVLACNQ